jgi:WhiB family transcriptional regulator, redox-sensing transcriptional regulator
VELDEVGGLLQAAGCGDADAFAAFYDRTASVVFGRLPVPVTDVWDWQIRGACRGMDSALFFHPEGERGPARSGREARAKQICASCPVLEQCRAHALAVHEPYGVWGGLSESERDVIVRRQDRPLRVVGPGAPVV